MLSLDRLQFRWTILHGQVLNEADSSFVISSVVWYNVWQVFVSIEDCRNDVL